MIVSVSKGSISFGSEEIFSSIDFSIKEKEKIALIGRNGSGKSTLLKVIAGELELSSGEVFRNRGTEIAYLRQRAFTNEERTVKDEFLELFSDLRKQEELLRELAKDLQINHSDEAIERFSRLQEEFVIAGGYQYEQEIKTVLQGFGFGEEILTRKLSSFSGGEKNKNCFCPIIAKKTRFITFRRTNKSS